MTSTGQGVALPPRLLHLLRSSQAAVLVHKDVAGGQAGGGAQSAPAVAQT